MKINQKFFILFTNVGYQIVLEARCSRGIVSCLSLESWTVNLAACAFFFRSICGCNEEINKYLGSVNIHPSDISVKEFCENFDLSKLDYNNSENPKMTESVVNMLKKIVQHSNTNIVKNADALLKKMPPETEVE